MSNMRVVEFSARCPYGHGCTRADAARWESNYLGSPVALPKRYTGNDLLLDDTVASVAEVVATVRVEYGGHEGFDPDPEAADSLTGTTGPLSS